MKVFIVGLVYDFCVGYTAFDAQKYGFKTYLVMDATKCVMKETSEKMDKKLDNLEKLFKITSDKIKEYMWN